MTVGDSLLVPSKKLWRWYHDNLSGFRLATAVKERHQHDFVVKTKNGKSKNIRVPILEVYNLGADMAIDEKQIGGDFYKILTNRKSGKIALLAKENNEPFVAKKFTYKSQKLPNGETILEALSRSRYLLYKYPQNWSETQRERAVALFELCPEIEKSYQLCCKFRAWYSKENVGRSVDEMRAELWLWYSEVDKENVMEMENFSSLVERNEGLILNYFVNGDTNAIVEATNSKIQRMITLNKGIKKQRIFLA